MVLAAHDTVPDVLSRLLFGHQSFSHQVLLRKEGSPLALDADDHFDEVGLFHTLGQLFAQWLVVELLGEIYLAHFDESVEVVYPVNRHSLPEVVYLSHPQLRQRLPLFVQPPPMLDNLRCHCLLLIKVPEEGLDFAGAVVRNEFLKGGRVGTD